MQRTIEQRTIEQSKTRVSEWHKKFKEGREDVEDEQRAGRPSTSQNEENVAKVKELFGHGIFPVGFTEDMARVSAPDFFSFIRNMIAYRCSIVRCILISTTRQNNSSLRARSTLCKDSEAIQSGRVVYLTSPTKVPAYGDHPAPLPLG
ncbi:unnamed protein product [Lasius platythorax]|uniref:Uncharacterized protein n=1 Tax=Lasius platythorax TaxID=488582 RepID=A0AAV2NBY1_9HYME